MKKYISIILCMLFIVCLFGCGDRDVGAEEAELDLRHGYWELNSLCGYGAADVSHLLGEELTFVEEKWDTTYSYASPEGHIYYFWKDADALYCIDYKNLTAEEAYEIAKPSHDAIVDLYGEDHSGLARPIHILESAEFLEKDYKPEKAPEREQYGESWMVPYNDRLGNKVKDFLDLENVSFGLNIRTPAFWKIVEGESFCVRVIHNSMPKQ